MVEIRMVEMIATTAEQKIRHRIVLTGGGTGGHIYPALAVAEQLQNDPDVESVLYIGASGHLEETLAKEKNLDFVGLSVVGMPRKISGAIFAFPFKTLSAVWQARKVLHLFRPTAVLGTGGYASAAPLAAARLMGIPYIVHEPDSNPGMVNKLFARSAAACSLGMAAAKEKFEAKSSRVFVNGNPVRASFLNPVSRAQAASEFGLRPELKTLLVTGGSQGAQAINDAVIAALPALLQRGDMQILHQVGEKNFAAVQAQLAPAVATNEHYRLLPYIKEMSSAYAASDMTVCRAGAMTISELSVMHVPAIFVPYPYAAQNHQMHNARFMESQGCAFLIAQNDLTAESLSKAVLDALTNGDKLETMKQAMQTIARPHAAQEIAKQLKEVGVSRAI
ncbi:MAG: undecaprenyldiphospho-muramoylpentapeptide beta-N-acetylglucosaminyltransferase [Candidatus Obscuribacterales bacterium]|nr:undecaprenyldiphospho-muramoylpentapeptide beta-N-acetylglucosaminyltransferase [Candidatus Obscuribacterales bacterium]